MMPSLLLSLVNPVAETHAIFIRKWSLMAKSLALPLILLLSINLELKGQCPPPGSPSTSDSCVQAPLLCTGLDGYCGTLPTNNVLQPLPDCPANTLNNDEWLSFEAASSTISLLITPTNCQGTNGQFGMQGAIYESCGGMAVATQCECTELPFLLEANLIPGQVYYLVLDGCAGDICDYSVEVLAGGTTCFPFIFGPTTVCNLDTVTYSIQSYLPQVYSTEWLPVSNASYSVSGDSISVVWEAGFSGSAQVCALFTYPNQVVQQVCLDVSVIGLVLPQPVGPSESCIFYSTTYETTDVQSCDLGQSFYWTISNGLLSSGTTATDSTITVFWNGAGIGQVCLNNIVGSDTIQNCLAVSLIECFSTCNSATFFCDGLDGFSATLDDTNFPAEFPGCLGFALNNPEWYAFTAGSNTISLEVVPSNCQGSNGQSGIQGAIYAGCGGSFPMASEPLALQCPCTDSPFTLSSSEFIPGQVYYLLIDGCSGDICDYAIEVLQGATYGLPSIEGPVSVCQGDAATYSLTIYCPQFDSINWTVTPTAIVIVNGDSALVQWEESFSGIAKVCATSIGSNQQPSTICLDVEVYPTTLPEPLGPSTVCQGDTVHYEITDLGGCFENVTYTWSVTNGLLLSNDSLPAIAIAWPDPPNGQVCLTAILNDTITVVNCLEINIIENCLPCNSLQADAGIFLINCSTSSITDTIIGTSNMPPAFASYQWTLNGVVVSTSDTVIVNSPGQYVFTVTNTLNGCSASDTLEFTEVLNLPIADAGPDMSIEPCFNPTATLDGSGSSVGPEFIYLWEGPGIIEPNLNPTVSLPGIYTLTVVNDENGCSATDEVEVSYLIVEIVLAIETTPDSCHTDSGTATLIADGLNPTILWSTGETTSTITGLAAGNYGVTVTYGFCVSQIFVVIDSVACTGTSELFAGTRFQLLPNPNSGQFSVLLDVPSLLSLELELVDVLGQTISTLQPMKTFGTGQHRLDFRQDWLPSGTYYLIVKNDKGRMGMKVEVVR